MAIPDTAQLIGAIYTKLSGDVTLTNLLGTYNPGAGAVTAIFTGARVPSKATLPYVSVRPVSNLGAFDTKDKRGLVFDIDIGAYSSELESSAELNSIVDRILELLIRQDLTLTDDLVDSRLTALTSAPTDDNIVGAILSIQFTVMEN
jgi:hypothetical protein